MVTSDQVITPSDSDTPAIPQDFASTALKDDQKLSIILDIARLLVTERDLETLSSRLLSSLIETFEAADAGVLRLYDPSQDQLIVQAKQGYPNEILRQITLSPGETTSGRAFETGEVKSFPTPQAIAAARANMTPEHQRMFAKATAGMGRSQSVISMPLITDQKIGILTLENRHQPGSFVSEDLPFWKALADLVALAIKNALLTQELQASQALSEANRLKAELISTLAHEMRTPLTSIKGYSTALLMEDIHFDPNTQAEFLQIIDEECDILQDLIHDLLESSIIDAGLLKIELQPVRLPRLAQTVADDMARRTDKHHLVLDFPEDFPIVDADPQRIAQVLRNLLDNAIKYSPEGGLIVMRGKVGETEITISVADQGVGLAPEDLNRLFEKFFRVKSGLGHHVVGSGLGLPICHTIVENHGGRIWAESKVGEGTTLYFTIPLQRMERKQAL
jgi:signal transduction histidine kinase